jgi:hypothetical protein
VTQRAYDSSNPRRSDSPSQEPEDSRLFQPEPPELSEARHPKALDPSNPKQPELSEPKTRRQRLVEPECPSSRSQRPEGLKPQGLETGSSMPPPRKTPASRIRDPRRQRSKKRWHLESGTQHRFGPEDRRRVGSSKDLFDTASFKELKEPASFARSSASRRTRWSIGVDLPALPRTPQQAGSPSEEPSSQLSRVFRHHDV